MTHPVLGIDHTFLLVNNLDESAELYRRLGFTLSPRGLHSAEKGTGNHTIVFQRDYLELLGIVSETPANLAQREVLARQGEGLQAVANRTRSADEAKPALKALGIETGTVSAFSRPLPLPDGTSGIAAFRTLVFDPAHVPVGHFFLCEQQTPDMVWRPELQDHANGANGLAAIIAIVDAPQATAQTYASFYAEGKVSAKDGGYRVLTGENSADLEFYTPEAFAARFAVEDLSAFTEDRYAALSLYTKDIERTKATLAASGVPFLATDRHTVVVSPKYTSGVVLEFLRG